MSLPLPKRLRGVKGAGHARAPKQEKAIAAKVGGSVVKGSGVGFVKGDVRVAGVARIEAKCTTKKSFSITQEMLDKIEEAAVGYGEVPAVMVEFIDDKGKVLRSVAVLPSWALESLISDANS